MTRDEPLRGDLRVQRTRNLIVEALIDLTIQKGFAAVTVQDIVTRAGINRATFYRHYQDKFDLLDQYVEAVYQLPDNPLEPGSLAGEGPAAEKMVLGLTRMLEHVRRHAEFFRVMLGKKRRSDICGQDPAVYSETTPPYTDGSAAVRREFGGFVPELRLERVGRGLVVVAGTRNAVFP